MPIATAVGMSSLGGAEPSRPGGGPPPRRWFDRFVDPVRWEPVHERLSALPVFSACSRSDVRTLARSGDECFVPAGTVLCREGSIGYWLFVVESGAVQLRSGRGRGSTVATLRSGSHFGDVAIIGFGPQPLTAFVVEDAVVFVLGRRYVLDLVHTMPGFRDGLFPGVDSEAALIGVVRELREAGTAAWRALPRRAVAELLARDRVEQLPPSVVAVPRRRASTSSPSPSPFAAALRAGSGSGSDGRAPVAVPPLDRRLVAAMVGVVVAVLVAFALSFHPDVLVVQPSATIDVSGDVVVSGVASHPPRGRYVVTAVDIEETTLAGLGLAVLRGEEVVRRSPSVGGGGVGREVGRRHYRESQQLAASLALARLGRGGASVRFRDRGLTGPSAGLVYALVVADMTDVVQVPPGRVVAASGDLGPDGAVRPVSFLDVKRRVARRAGATVFLVPSGGGASAGVIEVSNLDEALAAVGSGRR